MLVEGPHENYLILEAHASRGEVVSGEESTLPGDLRGLEVRSLLVEQGLDTSYLQIISKGWLEAIGPDAIGSRSRVGDWAQGLVASVRD